MNDKKNKLEQAIKVIKDQEELLENSQMEAVEGGGTDCSCDCIFVNSNTTPPPVEKPKENPDEKVLKS